MNLAVLHRMPASGLRELAGSLRSGALSSGLSTYALRQIAGQDAAALLQSLEELVDAGYRPDQIAVLVEALAEGRGAVAGENGLADLVLSGPDVPGIPTADTEAVVHTLIESARREILLVGYAVHNGRRLFSRLAERMQATPGLEVRMCLDISRPRNDTSLATEIVHRFAREFRKKHWPWPVMPELFYDPRSLDADPLKRSSLHAKCIVIDRTEALVTSANFTEAAQQRNIEVGLLVHHASTVERLHSYLGELMRSNRLIRVALLDAATGKR